MKYFVVSDVHGFYSLLVQTLKEKGFDETDPNHKLIICGDLMDRGNEAVKMQEFILKLMHQDKVILIKGNHESLMLGMLNDIKRYGTDMLFLHRHHVSNGTLDTLSQLTGIEPKNIFSKDNIKRYKDIPFVKKIIPNMVDYFETEHYIFVHGWIPSNCLQSSYSRKDRVYIYRDDWRNATQEAWEDARWMNGMELAHYHKVTEPNKTIVCGHFHCSYGWSNIKQKRKEFPAKNRVDWKKSFEPYKEDGVIAIDACTAYSDIINCIIIDD